MCKQVVLLSIVRMEKCNLLNVCTLGMPRDSSQDVETGIISEISSISGYHLRSTLNRHITP